MNGKEQSVQVVETFEIDQRDVVYRAEGNANIVLGLSGRNQVLRLPKNKRFLVAFFAYSSICAFLFTSSQTLGYSKTVLLPTTVKS